METLKEIQNEFLKCPICLQKFSNPKLLPCLHTFCRQCLTEYLSKYCETQNGTATEETGNNAQNGDTNVKHVCCPMCRSDVQLSVPHGNTNTSQWTELLPDNHFVSSLVEKIDMHTTDQNCESCSRDLKTGGAKADNWCHTCKILFCESCIKAHNVIKACREHKITSLKDMRSDPLQSIRENRREIPCFHHKDKFIEYYCVDCHVAICSSCVAVQHRRCEMVETINDAVEKLKPEAEYVTKSLQQQTETLLQWEKDHAKEIAMLSTNKEDMIRDMKMIRVKVNEVLMNLENKLIEDLDDKFKETAEEVRNKVKDIDEMKKNVQNTNAFFRNLNQFGSDSELLAVFDAIKAQVDDMRATIQKARLSQLSKSLKFAPDPCIERLLHLSSYGKIVDIIDLNKESFLSFNGLSEREPNTPHRRSSIKRTGTFRVAEKPDGDQQSPMQTGSSTSSMSSTSTDSISSQEMIPQVPRRRVPPKPSPRSQSAKTGMQRNPPVRAGTLPRNLKIRERSSLGSVTRVNSVGTPNGILSPGTTRKTDRNANVKVDTPEPPARKPAVPKQQAPPPPKKTSSVPLLFAFNGKTDGDAKKCWPLDVAVLEDGTPVITDFHNKKVKAFDASGTVMGEVAVPSWPHGIVDTGSKEVAVTLPELATIVFVSVQEKNMRIRKRLRTQKQYRGISCDGFTSTSNPVLVVSCCASGSQCVDILTFDGVVIQTYREDKNNPEKLLFTWPYYVATNVNGEIIVSDCQSRNAIMCVCRDGDVRYEEVLQDSLVGDPRGICADRQGNLFLADKTGNSVHCLDADGKYKAKVLAPGDGLLHPIAVCLSPFGHLIVTQENGEVKVFKYS